MDVDIKEGDIVSFGPKAGEATNAPELIGSYARVESVYRHEGQIVSYKLSCFYKDADCTIPLDASGGR
jgi:hypothetical protein